MWVSREEYEGLRSRILELEVDVQKRTDIVVNAKKRMRPHWSPSLHLLDEYVTDVLDDVAREEQEVEALTKERDELKAKLDAIESKRGKKAERRAFLDECRNAPDSEVYIMAKEKHWFRHAALVRIEGDMVVVYDHKGGIMGTVMCYMNDEPEISQYRLPRD
jgi:hypothetical protein